MAESNVIFRIGKIPLKVILINWYMPSFFRTCYGQYPKQDAFVWFNQKTCKLSAMNEYSDKFLWSCKLYTYSLNDWYIRRFYDSESNLSILKFSTNLGDLYIEFRTDIERLNFLVNISHFTKTKTEKEWDIYKNLDNQELESWLSFPKSNESVDINDSIHPILDTRERCKLSILINSYKKDRLDISICKCNHCGKLYITSSHQLTNDDSVIYDNCKECIKKYSIKTIVKRIIEDSDPTFEIICPLCLDIIHNENRLFYWCINSMNSDDIFTHGICSNCAEDSSIIEKLNDKCPCCRNTGKFKKNYVCSTIQKNKLKQITLNI